MTKYIVKSGSLDTIIEASNHRMAAMKAIEKYKPKLLGRIIGVLKEGEDQDNEFFMKIEFVLDCMGFKILD